MDTDLHSRQAPRAHKAVPQRPRKRLRAIDLWDRDGEELQQRQAKRFASNDCCISEKSPHRPDRSDLPEKCETAVIRPLKTDALDYAGSRISSESLLGRSHSDLKRPRSVSLHKHSNTEHKAGIEPRKRKRDNTLLVEPSGLHSHSSPSGQASQDALIGILLKELEDEQSKTKAFKEELERLRNPRGAAKESSGRPKPRRGKFTKHSTRREKKARANQLQTTTLSMGTPSMTTEPNQPQPTTLSMGSLSTRTGPDDNNHLVTFTKFEEFPDTVQDIIFGMLL
jgi:hypothetical protein